MLVRSWLALVLLAATLATSAGAQTAARRDTVVKTAGAPVHARQGTLVEELSIGVVDGDEEYMFGDIADMTLGNDGSIFVLDRRVPIVRQYDASGKFVRNVGRSGSGPGEYRSVSGIGTLKDGRLVLWDTGNWRVNVYSPAGQFITQWATPSGSANATATYSRALLVDNRDNVWCRGNIIKRTEDGVTRRSVWFRVDAGGIRDTLENPAMPDPGQGLRASNGNGSTSANLPFSPIPIVAKSPLGHFVTGFGSRYAFEIHEPGKPLTSIRRDGVRPSPVSSTERASERARIDTIMKRTDPAWSWTGPEIPSTKPFFTAINIGLDGRIWVSTVGESMPGPGLMTTSMGGGGRSGGAPPRAPATARERPSVPSVHDIFEPDGRYVGELIAPARLSLVLRRGDQVWAVSRNADDVASVKRLRIRWP